MEGVIPVNAEATNIVDTSCVIDHDDGNLSANCHEERRIVLLSLRQMFEVEHEPQLKKAEQASFGTLKAIVPGIRVRVGGGR